MCDQNFKPIKEMKTLYNGLVCKGIFWYFNLVDWMMLSSVIRNKLYEITHLKLSTGAKDYNFLTKVVVLVHFYHFNITLKEK